MKAQASALLLVACCLWTAEGQGEPSKKSIWEDPIQFATKTKDTCTMIVTGQGDLTKLRVSCKNKDKEYWCEYTGKPHMCRSYNNNPRHYFTQIMWDLRKLPNACQGARVIKPQMCKRAPDDAQMVFLTSWPRLFTPRPVRPTQERPPAQARPETPKPEAPKPEAPKPEPPKPEAPQPEEPKPETPKPEVPRAETSADHHQRGRQEDSSRILLAVPARHLRIRNWLVPQLKTGTDSLQRRLEKSATRVLRVVFTGGKGSIYRRKRYPSVSLASD
ncbi:hypothetical protein MATL_G00193680 [Megalops atlanticus]|uniref:Fibroblast growth factor binding protein 2 n=1 Tax=Megalops atlanticus TaxID=7932 RepID=A0A9D3PN89_MEGAT|nr:hypothetical protein MATL_G00193680 [Megalops atlanticus]